MGGLAQVISLSRNMRQMAMDTPMFYRIWFAHQRRHVRRSRRLPSSGDQFYLDGFPRSGNSYFTHAAREIFPSAEFAHHLHCLAPLKIALQIGIPTFVLMRDPENAVASRALQIRNGRMSALPLEEIGLRLLDDWRRYYSFCENHLEDLAVFEFGDAVNNPYSLLAHIGESVGLPRGIEDESVFEEFHRRYAEYDRVKPQGSTNFPDPKRAIEKEAVITLLKNMRELDEAFLIYNRLRDNALALDNRA